MFRSQHRIGTTTALSAILLIGLGALPASARQDPGSPVGPSASADGSQNCSLTRVGTQFVRCDNLTGNGVAAPAWISGQR
jgi:hypothetical protein